MVGPSYANRLNKLDIYCVIDLLLHVPTRYQDYSKVSLIAEARVGDTITFHTQVVNAINQYSKSRKQMQLVKLKDESGSIDAVWFNQKYLLSTFRVGTNVRVSGEVKWFGSKKALIAPDYEPAKPGKGIHTGRLVPIYPETKGLSSKWIRSRIAATLPLVTDSIAEYLPKSDLVKHKLISLTKAINLIHFPENVNDAEDARLRLSFNELLFLQLESALRKKAWESTKEAFSIKVNSNQIHKFTDSLPFKLTKSQDRVIKEIRNDLAKPHPMNRLLEGDVGSGKTVVAAAACFVAFVNGHQSVLMAPTQILAKQHYETLTELLSPLNLRISLITSAGTKKGLGKPDVIVGTHSLIHKHASFDNVAIVVIDEQHKFGVEQRANLISKTGKNNFIPDILTMTATPIPRTVALAAYGDLDLSTLDELPSGRKPVVTWIVPTKKRKSAYSWIEEQIAKHDIQAFVVCPLIEESKNEKLQLVKAVKVEYKRIIKEFPKRKVGLLHGKLKTKDKDTVLDKFKAKKTNILVSTPVIEVGIDIPNATIMVIEASDRFGLAQLHQLRGRVGRGKKKSYCLLFTDNPSNKVQTRLNTLKEAKTGFDLAEMDLKIRGPGEIFGTRQSGFKELKIASWSDSKLIKNTKLIADSAINNPPKYTKLINYIATSQKIAN